MKNTGILAKKLIVDVSNNQKVTRMVCQIKNQKQFQACISYLLGISLGNYENQVTLDDVNG